MKNKFYLLEDYITHKRKMIKIFNEIVFTGNDEQTQVILDYYDYETKKNISEQEDDLFTRHDVIKVFKDEKTAKKEHPEYFV